MVDQNPILEDEKIALTIGQKDRVGVAKFMQLVTA
jgi:hypothetical protein